MTELSIRDQFLQSLDRCELDQSFLPSFYARFLSSSEIIRYKFRHTNFEKQNQMLVSSLRLVSSVTNNDGAALRELRERAESHNRLHLNIKPDMYEYWRTALLETVAEKDLAWDADVERAWKVVLDNVINHMIKYY